MWNTLEPRRGGTKWHSARCPDIYLGHSRPLSFSAAQEALLGGVMWTPVNQPHSATLILIKKGREDKDFLFKEKKEPTKLFLILVDLRNRLKKGLWRLHSLV